MTEPRGLRDWLLGRGIGRLELSLIVALNAVLVVSAVVGYLAVRARDPELFTWGQHLLNWDRGVWMTAALPVGGLALLAAVHLAHRDRARWIALPLLVPVLAGGAFCTLAVIDYDSKAARRLVPGKRFKPSERYVASRFGVRLPREWGRAAPACVTPIAAAVAAPAKREVSAASGRGLFLRVCASCHGAHGEGIRGSGKELRASEFIATRDDAKLAEFLKVGRQPWEPDNTTKVQMPPRGGDPRIQDDDLRDIVAYLRELQRQAGATAAAAVDGATTQSQPATAGAGIGGSTAPTLENPAETVLVVHRSYIPEAVPGPPGLAPAFLARLARSAWTIPANAANFFAAFFVLSAVGSVQVLGALAGVVAILIAAWRRRPPAALRPGLLLGAAAWWWATACWVVVFGLLYAWR